MTKVSKNILKEASVLLIIVLMVFSSAAAMVNTVHKQTPVLIDGKQDSSLESEQRYTSGTQAKLSLLLDEGFEGSFPPVGWTQVQYSGSGWWVQAPYIPNFPYTPYCAGPPPSAGQFFADASSWDNPTDAFDVGLFTPALDLSACHGCICTLEYHYVFINMIHDIAMVNVYSGGTSPGNYEETLIDYTNSIPPGFYICGINEVLTFDLCSYSDPANVYIEFYYSSDGNVGSGKFGIDDVKIDCGGCCCPDGMVGYWKLDETHIGDPVDDSYGSNDGTNNGATINQPGQVATAYSFNGNNNYVKIDDHSSLNLGTDFTLEAWIKAPTGQKDYPAIIAKRSSSQKGDPGFLFGLWSNGNLHIQIGGISNNPGLTPLTTDTWHHVAVTRCGTAVTYYVDGLADGTEVAGNIASSPGHDLWIGRDKHSPASTPFKGLIDEVAIWNECLSAREILCHYNLGLAGHGYNCIDIVIPPGSGITIVADLTNNCQSDCDFNRLGDQLDL